MFDGENIKALKKYEETQTRAKLLDINRKFTESARNVINQVFESFSHEGKMSQEDCASFTKKCCSKK